MRTFILKLSAFIFLVIILQFLAMNLPIITQRIESDTFQQIALLEDCVRQQPQIIYFGDSVLDLRGPTDKGKTIPEMLQDLLPVNFVRSVNHDAYKANEYLLICRYFFRKKYYPKLMIIPINLRSFSPSLYDNPARQFKYLKAALANDINLYLFRLFPRPFFAIVNFIDPAITVEEYGNILVYDGERSLGKIPDYDKLDFRNCSIEDIEKDIICKYMYSLSNSQEKLAYLTDLVKLLKKENIGVVYYITPIDYETGTRYLGKRFIDKVNSNILVLQKIFKENNVENPLDLVFALKSDSFYWEKSVYEHLDEKGRRLVAQEIAKMIKDDLDH